jgi:uncharacterized BrkB/YihY/UPF0761 family membrane protein
MLFVGVVLLVLRYVPAERVQTRAITVPGVIVGLALGAFTQLFSLLAPLMTHVAAIYGTFVAAFAVLAWLSISFNLLLLGACWARVRSLGMAQPDAPSVDPTATGAPGMPGDVRTG